RPRDSFAASSFGELQGRSIHNSKKCRAHPPAASPIARDEIRSSPSLAPARLVEQIPSMKRTDAATKAHLFRRLQWDVIDTDFLRHLNALAREEDLAGGGLRQRSEEHTSE